MATRTLAKPKPKTVAKPKPKAKAKPKEPTVDEKWATYERALIITAHPDDASSSPAARWPSCAISAWT